MTQSGVINGIEYRSTNIGGGGGVCNVGMLRFWLSSSILMDKIRKRTMYVLYIGIDCNSNSDFLCVFLLQNFWDLLE